jgi:hypothetical protein
VREAVVSPLNGMGLTGSGSGGELGLGVEGGNGSASKINSYMLPVAVSGGLCMVILQGFVQDVSKGRCQARQLSRVGPGNPLDMKHGNTATISLGCSHRSSKSTTSMPLFGGVRGAEILEFQGLLIRRRQPVACLAADIVLSHPKSASSERRR